MIIGFAAVGLVALVVDKIVNHTEYSNGIDH
jgi:hypothetical protein